MGSNGAAGFAGYPACITHCRCERCLRRAAGRREEDHGSHAPDRSHAVHLQSCRRIGTLRTRGVREVRRGCAQSRAAGVISMAARVEVIRMRRREFIAAAATLLFSSPRSWAQGKPRRIAYLGVIRNVPFLDAWGSGLRENGWIDGKNLIIEYRHAESPDRLPTLAADLIALNPDLLIAAGPQPAVALKSATTSIPILFVAVFDPVALGLVQSLSHPGGNATGLATFVPGDFVAKRIEILREIVPSASKIAILINPGNPMHGLVLNDEVPRTTRNLGVTLPILEATTPEELDIAFASAAAQR